MSRLRDWWECSREGHRASVWIGWLMPKQAVVRCECGRGIRPRLVYIETEGVSVVRDDSQTSASVDVVPADRAASPTAQQGTDTGGPQ